MTLDDIIEATRALETAKPSGAWGMTKGGRKASKSAVRINLERLTCAYHGHLIEAASYTEVPVIILLALSCRESNHGHSLDAQGFGDGGHGFGVLQVDVRHHKVVMSGGPRGMRHLVQGGNIWRHYLDLVALRHPNWEAKYLVKAACVAYNSGPNNVRTIERMDAGTTHNDYGADVMARAQFYDEAGY